ncbi:MAG: hypothetical protein CFE24_14470 [Flavobacterium sp. BFFFF2]|nr:MAG: hypothetical protein CFE24_14470 [Flavobacterium sp. BFFFF2]
MFFNDNILRCASYFLSEDIFYINNSNIIYAYKNTNRDKGACYFKSDLPNEVDLKYLDYKQEFPNSRFYDCDTIVDIIFNKNENTIDLKFKTKLELNKVYKNIQTYKFSYKYFAGELILNETFKHNNRLFTIFKVDQVILDRYFSNYLQESK